MQLILPGVWQPQSLMVDKLILKATHRGGKELKLFVLRNMDCGEGCNNLKSTIKK